MKTAMDYGVEKNYLVQHKAAHDNTARTRKLAD